MGPAGTIWQEWGPSVVASCLHGNWSHTGATLSALSLHPRSREGSSRSKRLAGNGTVLSKGLLAGHCAGSVWRFLMSLKDGNISSYSLLPLEAF